MRADDVLAFHQTLSNWGRWGDDDQLGALNLITPEVTAAAAATVRAACRAPAPSTPAAADNPTPVAHHMTGTASEGMGVTTSPFRRTASPPATSTRCATSSTRGSSTTATRRGRHRTRCHQARHPPPAAGIVTRGVLFDIPALRGVDALEPGEPVFPEDLEAAEEKAGLTIGRRRAAGPHRALAVAPVPWPLGRRHLAAG